MSTRLVELIDDYKARNGNPSDRSIARAMEVSEGVISAWRTRGIRELPDPETLRRLAEFLRVDPDVTYYAAGVDAGYIIEQPDPNPRRPHSETA